MKTLSLPQKVITALLLSAVLFIGCASAAELSVEMPPGTYGVGDIISIPVILKNDLDFEGFQASVNNNIDGVTVSIKENPAASWAMFFTTGDAAAAEQKVLGMSLQPMKDEQIPLFNLNIVINDENVKSVPLKITLDEVIAGGRDIPCGEVKQVDLSGLKLTDTVSATIVSEAAPEPTPLPTAVSARPDAGQTAQSPSVQKTQGQSTPAHTESTSPVAAKTSARSPGFGIGIIIAALGAGAVVRTFQQRRW